MSFGFMLTRARHQPFLSATKTALFTFLVLVTALSLIPPTYAADNTDPPEVQKLEADLDKAVSLSKDKKFNAASEIFRDVIDRGFGMKHQKVNFMLRKAILAQCMNASYAKDYTESLFYCEMSIREFSRSSENILRRFYATSLRYKITALKHLNKTNELIDAHKTMIREFKGNADPTVHNDALKSMVGLADYYREVGNPQKALPLYQEVIDLTKDDKTSQGEAIYYFAYSALGLTYADLGETQKAKNALNGFINFYQNRKINAIQEKVKVARQKLTELDKTPVGKQADKKAMSIASLRELSHNYLYDNIRYDKNDQLQVNVPKIREMMARFKNEEDLVIQKNLATAGAMTGYYLKGKKDNEAAQEFYLSYIMHSRDILDADFQRMNGNVFMLAGLHAFKKKNCDLAINIFNEMEARLGHDTSEKLERSLAIARLYDAFCYLEQGNPKKADLLYARIIDRHQESQNTEVRNIVSSAMFYSAAHLYRVKPDNQQALIAKLEELEAFANPPSTPKQRYMLAKGLDLKSVIYDKQGKKAEAIKCIDKAISLYKTVVSKNAKASLAAAKKWREQL